MKRKRKAPQIVLREGKPAAVILDLDAYEDLLERAEEVEDLKTLQRMREKPLHFRTLDVFLREKTARG